MNKSIVTIFFVVLLIAFSIGGFFIFKSTDIGKRRTELFPPTGGANSESFNAPMATSFSDLDPDSEKEAAEIASEVEKLQSGQRPNLNLSEDVWAEKTSKLGDSRVSSSSGCRVRPPNTGVAILGDQLTALKAGTQNVVIIPNFLFAVCLVSGGVVELVTASPLKSDIAVTDHGMFRVEGLLELDPSFTSSKEFAEIFGLTRRGFEMWLSVLSQARPGITSRIIARVSKVDPAPEDTRSPAVRHAHRLIYSMAGDHLTADQFLGLASGLRREEAILIDVRDPSSFNRDRPLLASKFGRTTLLNIPMTFDGKVPDKFDLNTVLSGTPKGDWGKIRNNLAILAVIGDSDIDLRMLMAMKATYPQSMLRPYVIRGGVDALRQ